MIYLHFFNRCISGIETQIVDFTIYLFIIYIFFSSTAWHLRLRQYYPDQEVINEHTDPILAETPHYKEKQTILPNPISAEHHNEKKVHTPLKRTHDGKLKKEKKDLEKPPLPLAPSTPLTPSTPSIVVDEKLVNDPPLPSLTPPTTIVPLSAPAVPLAPPAPPALSLPTKPSTSAIVSLSSPSKTLKEEAKIDMRKLIIESKSIKVSSKIR